MPRFLVERTFPDGLNVPLNEEGAAAFRKVIDNNAKEGVTWVTSFFTPDRRKSVCVYDAPSPESIHTVAQANSLPVDRITEVRVLDPYFFR